MSTSFSFSFKRNNLFDTEADEEDEESGQAGLGDFGFGTTTNFKDLDDERNALKLRDGDLDHIVDDISDDEGDEEAGRAARLAQEREDDRLATKKVITAVTLGHEAVRNAKQKGKYAFDKLTAGRDDDKRQVVEEGGEEEEEDYEERLQRGLSERNQSEMMRRRSGMNGDDSEDDEYQSESEEEDEMHNGEELTEDQRKSIAENKQRIRDQQDAAIIKRKQFEQHTKMKRALRRKLQSDSQVRRHILSLISYFCPRFDLFFYQLLFIYFCYYCIILVPY